MMVGIVIACLADSYHKINEGNVGIYYRHGALLDRVTDPGVHFLKPFIESYIEIMIRYNAHHKYIKMLDISLGFVKLSISNKKI